MQTLPPSGRPLVFGTEDVAGVDYLLPMSLSTGTCKARIVPLSLGPDIKETLTPRYVAHNVNRMALKCVIPPPHIGGEGGIGSKGVIALAVGGQVKPRNSGLEGKILVEQGVSLGLYGNERALFRSTMTLQS